MAEHEVIEVKALFKTLEDAVKEVQAKLKFIQENKDTISIANMFEMQLLMNHLSQLSEMTTNVVSACHSSIMAMAKNVRG